MLETLMTRPEGGRSLSVTKGLTFFSVFLSREHLNQVLLCYLEVFQEVTSVEIAKALKK